ncbi:MAG: NAD(P)H-binding protein [Bdellovibrionaceae bacterium]|nr:NAD(P)H-binding protein [Pseudobdellovibrionaceae bacterium]
MSQILIVGASGTVGSQLSEILKSKGQKALRATSKTTLESDQVHLNLVNQSGLEKAFENIDRLFLLSPPGHTNQNELLAPLVDMAKKKNVKKVVLMTAMGANAVDTSPMRQAEIKLEKSGLKYNIIRPNWFMQNFNTFWIQGINNDNKIYLPVGKAKGSFIDARDIAAVAAELLVSHKFDNQDFDLTGPEPLDHDHVASLISQATGRTITFQDITPEAMRQGLLQAGLPKDYSEFLITILGFFKEGYSARTTDAVEKITGNKPRTVKQYTIDYKSAWTK